MDIKQLLGDRVLVTPLGQASLETTLELPDFVRHSSSVPQLATFKMCGPGRRDLQGNLVPTLTDLGWKTGDVVVVLKKFDQSHFHTLRHGGSNDVIIQDFDVLGRVVGDWIEPSYNRVLLRDKPQPRKLGRIMLPGRVNEKRPPLVEAEVVDVGLALHETFTGEGGMSNKTEEFLGYQDIELEPGAVVFYQTFSSHSVELNGEKMVIANIEDVQLERTP